MHGKVIFKCIIIYNFVFKLTDMSGVKNFDFPLSNGDDYSDSEEEDNPALIDLSLISFIY